MINTILESFKWYDHPEGLKFIETHRDNFRTSGHWLLLPGAISAFHRVKDNDELWYIHNGAIALHVIDEKGLLITHRLGTSIKDGEVPVVSVPKNCWQAAELGVGAVFGFGSVVCAPPFQFENFEIAKKMELTRAYPKYADLISRLTL